MKEVYVPWDHPHKVYTMDAGTEYAYDIDVDVEIYELVEALNQIELRTYMSCQDNVAGRAWVAFWNGRTAGRFMELVAANSERLKWKVLNGSTEEYDKLRDRMVCEGRWWIDAFISPSYSEDSTPYEYPNEELPEPNWTGEINVRISIRFPREHLEEVTQIIVAERDRRET